MELGHQFPHVPKSDNHVLTDLLMDIKTEGFHMLGVRLGYRKRSESSRAYGKKRLPALRMRKGRACRQENAHLHHVHVCSTAHLLIHKPFSSNSCQAA